MKKNTILIALAVALFATFSCQEEPQPGRELSSEAGPQGPTVLAEGQICCLAPRGDQEPAEDAAVETKTSWGAVYDGNKLDVLWLNGDQLKLYGESCPEGAVYATTLAESSSTATFTATGFIVGDATRYAVYPASMAGAMQDGKIPVDLGIFSSQAYHSTLNYYGNKQIYDSSEQDFAANSIVPHLPLFSSSDGDSFQFQNLCGGVILRLNDYQGRGIKISTVKITADKYISGTMLVNPADGTVTLTGISDEQKSITVVSGSSGTAISGATPGLGNSYNWFFFLPVGTYNGFTFTITDTDGNVYTRSTDTEVTVNPGKVSKFPVTQFTIYYGKANCIVANPGSTVDIDITPYYTFDNGFSYASGTPLVNRSLPALTAEVSWEQGGVSGPVIDGTPVIAGRSTLRLRTGAGSAGGNALVSVKNGTRTIWSYHIWVRNTGTGSDNDDLSELEVSAGVNTYHMLDRNLGASRGAVTDAALAYKTYGMLYQWGRKEPLPISGTATYSDGATVSFDSGEKRSASIQYLLDNPLERVQETGANRSVLPQVSYNLRLWGAPAGYGSTDAGVLTSFNDGFTKSVYDPCPEGYMVPQAYFLSNFSLAKSYRQGYGAWLLPDGVNEEYFALPGYVSATLETITSGTTKTTTAGKYGWYWCANPYGSGGWAGYFYKLSYGSSVTTGNGYGGSSACMPVRCMRIPGSEVPDIGGGQQPAQSTAVRVGIMGDSISTFKDWIPSNFRTFYPKTAGNGNSLTDVEQTWWHQLIYSLMPDATLDANLSYSASLVTKINDDSARDDWPFPNRCSLYEDPDIVILHGGTNDRGVSRGFMVPLGTYDYDVPVDDLDITSFRSAYIKTIRQLQANYPGVKIVFIINKVLYVENTTDETKNYIKLAESIQEIADHYGLPVVSLRDVSFTTLDGLHPDPAGALVIANEVYDCLDQAGLLSYRRPRD